VPARAEAELKVTVIRDHDDECSVVAELVTGGFSGRGRAWLHIADVSEFAAALTKLVATNSGEAKLYGGYLTKDGSPDPTVNVRLAPHGSRGYISVAAELASDPTGESTKFVSRMSGAIIVEPAALERFADRLLDIPKGAEVEAVVPGEGAT
jgi:hypothetical protein